MAREILYLLIYLLMFVRICNGNLWLLWTRDECVSYLFNLLAIVQREFVITMKGSVNLGHELSNSCSQEIIVTGYDLWLGLKSSHLMSESNF